MAVLYMSNAMLALNAVVARKKIKNKKWAVEKPLV